MKIRLSAVYAAIFVLGIVGLAIGEFLTGNLFNPYLVFTLFFFVEFQIVMAVIFFENKMIFMDLDNIPKMEQEPLDDKIRTIGKYILDNLQLGMTTELIISSLRRSGYEDTMINEVFNALVNDGSIKVNEIKSNVENEVIPNLAREETPEVPKVEEAKVPEVEAPIEVKEVAEVVEDLIPKEKKKVKKKRGRPKKK